MLTAVRDRYREEVIRHKLMPFTLHYNPMGAHEDGTPAWESPNFPAWAEAMEHWIVDMKVNAMDFQLYGGETFDDPFNTDRQNMINWLRGFYSYFDERDWGDLLYIFLDEPNTEEQYEYVRQWGDLIHEADPNIKLLVTE